MANFVELSDINGNVQIPVSPIPIISVTGSTVNLTMTPNFHYACGELSSLTIALGQNSYSNFASEYSLSFSSGSTPTTIYWPDGLHFRGSSTAPEIKPNAYYEISIMNGCCVVTSYGIDEGGGGATDVQINGTSITNGGVANIVTQTAYNASTNPIATASDLPIITFRTWTTT